MVSDVEVLARIRDVPAAEWDACAGGHPFVSHAFLSALEDSGSAVAESGWLPQHLVIRDERGIVAAAPAYLKTHSYGEYVFDWGWADAYRKLGKRYYPKLQCCVPFTPVTGPRLMVRSGADAEKWQRTLCAALVELARLHGASSAHVTFPGEAEWRLGGEAGLLQRAGIQYHWHDRGYSRFEDFLADLLGRKRHAILRERRDACAGLTIDTLRGAEITERHWDAFDEFYRDTISRKWGQPYLSRAFFEQIGETMGDSVVLFVAREGQRLVAAALNLLGPDALYGRYWGAAEERPFLHFELCYYRAIELAIELKLARVEAGAQGEHKIARGYLPARTHSLHWIADERMAAAVGDFVARERVAVDAEIAELTRQSPFRDARAVVRSRP